MGEEGREFVEAGVDIFRGHFEATGDVDQLVQVFDARLAIATLVVLVEVAQTGVEDRMLDLLGKTQRRGRFVAIEAVMSAEGPCEVVDQSDERLERVLRAPCE